MRPWLVAVTLVFVSSLSAYAQRPLPDVHVLGPQVGEMVPNFSLVDQDGEEHTVQSILGPKGAMLVFARSASW